MRPIVTAIASTVLAGVAYGLWALAWDEIRWNPRGALILALCGVLVASSGLRGWLCRRSR